MATENQALAMAERLAHRGPDSAAAWVDAEAGIALSHRRLSIIDLSAAGRQPMHSADGRYVLAYNGEVYNHHDLRRDVELAAGKWNWRGHSDTETLLAAIQVWGLVPTLERTNGMFAIALWDRQLRTLLLARDRMGEKPLYYGSNGNRFLFASELKAFRALPDWRPEVDGHSVALYLRHGYVPDPFSIHKGISKLKPAHFVEIQDGVAGKQVCYWDLAACVKSPRLTASDQDLTRELDARLTRAVGMRMEADVPLGAFLSGGVDSSVVVSLMQKQSHRPVRTFTIGFDDNEFNEADSARVIAGHLGTEHTEHVLTQKDALGIVPELPLIWDEPFADSSQLPTLLLSRMTRRHVTVALSGDGGDELFCGYGRYAIGNSLTGLLDRFPDLARSILARILRGQLPKAVSQLLHVFPSDIRQGVVLDRIQKLGDLLDAAGRMPVYKALVSTFLQPQQFAPAAEEPSYILSHPELWPKLDSPLETFSFLDMLTYLPGDILTKVDRASMAASLEARVPLLDHELVSFAWQLPLQAKVRDDRPKWLLRQVLENYVPRSMFDRPKKGFSVPLEKWLSGALKPWAEDLLSESSLAAHGQFDVKAVRALWSEHCSGRRRWHSQLWNVLMFQAWAQTTHANASNNDGAH